MEILLHKVAAMVQNWIILCKTEFHSVLKEKIAELHMERHLW